MKGMDVDTVESCANRLSTGANGLDDLVAVVSNLQGPLQDCWVGSDADACVDFIAKLTTDMQNMSVEVMKIHSWVESTKENYVDAANSGAQYYRQ